MLHCVYLAAMLIRVSGVYDCFDLLSSACVWLRTIRALRNEACSDGLFYACGNSGPLGHFSFTKWPRVNNCSGVSNTLN